MAGSNASFDKAAFTKAIHFVMDMAAPPLLEEQAVFIKASVLVYNVNGLPAYADQEGVPFDPNSTVTRAQPAPVRVHCAVEYQDSNGVPTDFGLVTPSRAVITVLDQEYALIKDSVAVILKGERFNYRHTEFPTGLFDIGIYSLHWVAQDQN